MGEPFFRSFLAGEAGAQLLLPASFRDLGRRRAHVRRAAERSLAPGMLEVLREQNQKLPTSDARTRNLESLAGGAVAVVTGQQLGLLLGPLFTYYKAASAIAAARALERETNIRCVPVFWLQTEDHDFPEIDHCHILLPDGSRKRLALSDPLGDTGQRVSVVHRILGEDCGQLGDALENHLGGLPFSKEVLPLIREHYRPGQSLAGAFAGMLAALFADEGLILFDPRNAAVAKMATPMFRTSLIDSDRIAAALLERTQALERAGFAVQVHVRQGSPLFFFHRHRAEGPRFRLERGDLAWSLAGTNESIATDELLRILEAEPLRFSSSALLRPILQDHLLPTAAYVGGPAELNYSAQLPPLYEHFQLSMPLVIPRARFRFIESRARSLLDKLHLQPSEVERPRDQLRREVADAPSPDYPSPEVVRGQLMDDFARRLDDFHRIAQSLDPGLLKALDRTRTTVARAVSRLSGRYSRVLLEKDRVVNDRIDRLRSMLLPDGVPQERFDSLPYFACKYGLAPLKEKLFASLDPFAAEIRDVQL
jgi:bacillithiol biosynthesis cysteine-adding enzyme BshC